VHGSGLMGRRARLLQILVGVTLLFIALVALRVHGFSLARWHDRIDGSDPDEVLLGHAQEERWDDWTVQLPLALAQIAHDPQFPLVNRDIGIGQNMLVPIAAPVWHPLALFRPTLWGFFLGPDVGLAWMWWSQLLGLFAVWLAVFAIVTRGNLGLAAAAALMLVFAPLFQLYSFNAAPFAIWIGLAWIAATRLLSTSRRRTILASGCLLGWSGACFALAPYPPYQIPLAYLFLALLAGFAWQRRDELQLRAALRIRMVACAIAITIVVAAVADLWVEAHDTIEIMRATEYPGRRIEVGGGIPFWHLVNPNFWIPIQVTEFGALGPYRSSSASFWITWPVVAAATLWRTAMRREKIDPVVWALALYCAAISIYCVWGIPDAAARASLFVAVPAHRAMLGLGLGDVALLVAFLSQPCGTHPESPRSDAILAVLWAAALGACALALHEALPETKPLWMIAGVIVNGALAFAILRRARPAAVASLIAGALALSTLGFNPLALGGSHYLLDNDLSKMIVDLDRRSGGRSTWISYGGDQAISNLFRVLGVRALDGTQPTPQLEMWKSLDPTGHYRRAYNRFAHVRAEPTQNKVRFWSSREKIMIELDPEGPEIEQLGVTHLLVRTNNPAAAIRFRSYQPAARAGYYTAYELPLRRRSVPTDEK